MAQCRWSLELDLLFLNTTLAQELSPLLNLSHLKTRDGEWREVEGVMVQPHVWIQAVSIIARGSGRRRGRGREVSLCLLALRACLVQ